MLKSILNNYNNVADRSLSDEIIGGFILTEKISDIIHLLNNYRSSQHIPGLVVSLIQDGEIVYTQGFGTTDIEQPYQLVKPDTLFSTQGITESFTATCLAHLENQSTFSLNDPVTTYLPYFKSNITTNHLLSHSSGFTKTYSLASLFDEDLINITKNMPEYKQMFQKVPNYEYLKTTLSSRRNITEYLSEVAVDLNPGEQFYHWKDGYIIASHILEQVSGLSWEEYAMKYIIIPLDLENTFINSSNNKDQSNITKYYMKGAGTRIEVPRPHNIVGAPASSIYSTAADLATYLMAQMKENEILPKASLEKMQTTQIKIDDELRYGLGWKINDNLGMKILEQTGNSLGISSAILFVPEKQFGLVLLCNTDMIKLGRLGQRIIRRWFNKEE